MTKREKIGEGDDARYVRRDDEGKFTEDQVDVGRSSAADQRRDAANDTKPGQGDKGDRKSWAEESTGMAPSGWRGSISCGMGNVPVEAYTAARHPDVHLTPLQTGPRPATT